jgi:DNA polymerase-4
VGPVTARKLRDRGLTTVGQVAALAEAALVSMLGRAAGGHLHALAHNRDPRLVRTGRRRRSIGAQRALGRSPRSWNDLDAVLVALVDRLARRLRAARRVCRTVTLRMRFDDFSRATRSHTLPEATAHTQRILATARGLLATAMSMIEKQGVTLLGVSLSNLADDGAIQLALPLDHAYPSALDAVLDDIHDRFGTAAVTRAVLLGRDQGLAVPLLPD